MFFVTAGDTNQTIDVFLQDSSSSTGDGLTSLVYNSSGLTCYYRKGATGTMTQLTLATQTVGGAHSDGGFVEVDATNAPGVYRLDLSDTMVAAEGALTIFLQGATNLLQTAIRVHVASATRGYTGTAVPAAAADAAGGLPISDAGGLDLDGLSTFDETTGTVDVGKINGNATAATQLALSAAQIITGTISNAVLTPTTTAFAADDITEATADHYNGRVIIFTSGALAGQATSIEDYSLVSAEGNFTVVAMTEAPANNDTFIII